MLPTTAGRPGHAALALLVIGLAALVPLWSVAALPASDYPAHLARLHLLSEGLDPITAQFYRIEPQLLPNLAIDLTVPPLARLLGVDAAFRVVISVIALLPLAAAALLQSTLHGRIGLGAVVAGAFLFNRTLTLGFYNSAAGAGFALVALALWIRLAPRPALRLAVTTLLACTVWLCHAFPFLLLGLMIGVWELAEAWRENDLSPRRLVARFLPVALAFAPGIVAFAATFHAPGDAEIEFNVRGNVGSLIFAGADDGTFSPAPLIIAPVVFLGFVVWREKRFRLPSTVALLCAVLVALAITMPESIAGGTNVSQRIAPVLWTVLFAGAAFDIARRTEVILVGATTLVILTQTALLTHAWIGYDAETAEFRRALTKLPEGTRILPITETLDRSFAPHFHLVDYTVIDRHGFSPIFFTLPGQQIVRRTPAAADLGSRNTFQNNVIPNQWLLALDDRPETIDAAVRFYWPWVIGWSCRFDAVASFHVTDGRLPADPRLVLIEAGSFFDLYGVAPADHCRNTPSQTTATTSLRPSTTTPY